MNLLKLKKLIDLINELSVTDPSELTMESKDDSSHWEIGKVYFIRTVTHHLTGRIEKVTDKEIVLSSAAWIPDDGKFSKALSDEKFDEVEPFPDGSSVILGRGSLIDAVQISQPQLSEK